MTGWIWMKMGYTQDWQRRSSSGFKLVLDAHPQQKLSPPHHQRGQSRVIPRASPSTSSAPLKKIKKKRKIHFSGSSCPPHMTCPMV